MAEYNLDRARSRAALRNPKQYNSSKTASKAYTFDKNDLEVKRNLEAAHQRLLELARSYRGTHWHEDYSTATNGGL